MSKRFWGGWFGNAKRFSLEDLHYQYATLVKHPVVNEGNRALVVETIRSIAEFMIWGDQNEPKVFEFFLENNVMVYLHKILLQSANRRGDVAKQVLQTLGIIIQNVKSETGIFFLFSNNHINNIVELEFDFEDDEVLGYYVSFLKTISLKLNPGTVQFFFNHRSDHKHNSFPLYMQAIKLAHHKEGMVRATVRTLTLNIYCVNDVNIQEFIVNHPASQYFAAVAGYVADQIQVRELLQVASLPPLNAIACSRASTSACWQLRVATA
jgi:protein CLEC16A